MAKWILPLLLLVGCGGGGDPAQIDPDIISNYGYGYGYNYIDHNTGLRVSFLQPEPAAHYTLPEIINAYISVQTCANLYAPGPLVIVADRLQDGRSGGNHYWKTGTIVIADKFSLRHEMIHYLLQQTGFPRDRNNQHDSILFTICS